MIRAVEAAGGFAAVVRKGERGSGIILAILTDRGVNTRLFERVPAISGNLEWTQIRAYDPENKEEFQDYLDRRTARDPDLWIVELDIADGERFIP